MRNQQAAVWGTTAVAAVTWKYGKFACAIHRHMLIYKLPKFYNAYATGSATMICFILEPSVFIPKGAIL